MTSSKPYYRISHSPLLRPFLCRPVFAIAVHWTFQGMLYMDRTELLFKIGLDLILTALFFLLLSPILGLSWAWALLAASLVAHTLNFLFNAQLWVVVKYFRFVKHSRDEFDAYLQVLAGRIRDESSIRWAAAYGSLVRGEWHESSDLDVRLIRRPGLRNALRACWFVLRERTRSLFGRFPLDILVWDSQEKLVSMREDEIPAQIKLIND